MIQRPDRIEVHNFDRGYATTEGTVKLLADKVREEHTDPRIRARARQILRDYGPIDSLDIDGEIRAVWDFILDHVRYVRDPLGAEHITGAVELDREIDDGSAMEDCESLALYAATILAAIGIPSEFEIQGRNPDKPERFTHCSLRVKNPRTLTWTSFDLVGAFEFPGQFDLGDTLATPGDPLERWTLDGERSTGGLFSESDDSAGLLGAAFGDDLATAKQYGDPIAAGASSFGPYGALVAGLWQGGTAIASAAQGSPKPAPAPTKSTISVTGQKAAPSSPKLLLSRFKEAAKEQVAEAEGGKIPSWVKPVGIAAGALVLVKILTR